LTAGSGKAGDGDADRLNAEIDDCAGDPENEDRRLEEKGGGFIGREMDVGVPGVDGVGEGATGSCVCVVRVEVDTVGRSPGAGLPEMRRAGSSIRVDRLYCESVNCPSRVLRAQICTDRSLLCVAMYSPNGSHATPCT